jgi:steroid delta-isomerase-like uncharacterized protein
MQDPAAAAVATRYFSAIARQDLDAALACWAPGGVDHLAPIGELRVPDELRAYFEELFAAVPDFEYEVASLIAEGDLVAVHWRATGTFTGAPLQGIRANGARLKTEGADLVRVEDGLIVRLDSYWDDAGVARQIGILPARGSRQERALTRLFNGRTRAASLLARRGKSND